MGIWVVGQIPFIVVTMDRHLLRNKKRNRVGKGKKEGVLISDKTWTNRNTKKVCINIRTYFKIKIITSEIFCLQ